MTTPAPLPPPHIRRQQEERWSLYATAIEYARGDFADAARILGVTVEQLLGELLSARMSRWRFNGTVNRAMAAERSARKASARNRRQ